MDDNLKKLRDRIPKLLLRGLPLLILTLTACQTPSRPGTEWRRRGDEIVVAGHFVHTGTPVVTWLDPGGYDAYRVERRFSELESADWETSQREATGLTTPNRYGWRRDRLTADQIERFRGGGWEFAALTNVVDQFVLHFDACGTSRRCFKVLHDLRGLSVHFLLDLDGTIYQTLDLKERAWHATTSNSRSIGIEIAHIGGYPPEQAARLEEWYRADAAGRVRLTIPERFGDGGILTPNFQGYPDRPDPIRGVVQGVELVQYDFTPQQYRALAHLTATLCRVFPAIRCDYPRGPDGLLIREQLAPDDLAAYRGVLGHWHVQANKVDPGPAFQWDRLRRETRELLQSGRTLDTPKGRSQR
jgi:N-acetyl-anhydromuramyl-L-alanine amidase AmpD